MSEKVLGLLSILFLITLFLYFGLDFIIGLLLLCGIPIPYWLQLVQFIIGNVTVVTLLIILFSIIREVNRE